MSNTPTKLDDVLIRFFNEVEIDVHSENYKDGIVITKAATKAKAALSAMVSEAIGNDTYIDYTQRDLYGAGQIERLEAINSEKHLQRQIATALGFTVNERNG